MFRINKQSNALRDPTPIDWLATVVFLGLLFVVLLGMEIVQRLTLLISRNLHQQAVLVLVHATTFLLKCIGTQFHVSKESDLAPGKPYIFVCNHQSLFDIPILHTYLDRHHPRYVAKHELASPWLLSIACNLKHGGSALINRSDAAQALPEISALGQRANAGNFGVVIFAEGTRSKDGELKRFHSAGVIALLDAMPDATVVPVTIDGSWHLAGYSFGPIPGPIPIGTKISVHVGDPIEPEERKNSRAVIRECRKQIEAALRGTRA